MAQQYPISPAGLIVLKTLPQALILWLISYVIMYWLLTVLYLIDVRIVFSIGLVVVLMIGWAPALIIIHRRPMLRINPETLDIKIDSFFRKRWVRRAFRFKGYDDKYLDMIINFAKETTISFSRIQCVTLQQKNFMHIVRIQEVNAAPIVVFIAFRKHTAERLTQALESKIEEV